MVRVQLIVASPREPALITDIEVLDHESPRSQETPNGEHTEQQYMFAGRLICRRRFFECCMRLEDSLKDEDRHQQTRQHVREENQVRPCVCVRAIGRGFAVHVVLWSMYAVGPKPGGAM